MASCKDCICYSGCSGILNDFGMRLNPAREVCDRFENHARFVELPCKLGDFVYFIKARRVMADIVSRFTVDRCGVMLQRVNGYNLGYTDQLGKKIFLTHEEAEAALKERENNA